MTTRYQEKRYFSDAAIMLGIFLMLMAGIVALAWMILGAIEKEQAFNDEIRAERCSKMGERIPKQMEHYCDGVGA